MAGTKHVLLTSLLCIALSAAACDRGPNDIATEPAVTAIPGRTATAPLPAASAQPGNATSAAVDEQALNLQLRRLRALVLASGDIPAGFQLNNDEAISKKDIAAADISIPVLSSHLLGSDMTGAWLRFYIRKQPASGLSSIVYLFGTPASASAFIAAISALTGPDYPRATAVERVQSDKIGDVSQMMRYRLPGARTLEYTWAQGRLAGQVVLRYSGDTESPDDVAQLVVLARKQSEQMARAAP